MTTPKPRQGGSNVVWLVMMAVVVALGFVGWREWTSQHHVTNAAVSAPAAEAPAAAPVSAVPDSTPAPQSGRAHAPEILVQ